MSNTLLNISMITLEALAILENNLTFTKGVKREYDDSFGKSGAKIGDTLNIRKPARYVGRTGTALSTEDLTETSIPLQLNVQRGVDVIFTSKELTLNIDEFKRRVLAPAVANIANGIDRDGLVMATGATYNQVGTPGTVPAALLTYLQAGAKMDYMACPRDGQRSLVVDPLAQATIVDALKGLFQSSDKIKNQYESGNMGVTAGFKWSMDQNIVSQTVGPQGGTPAVNGASQTGSSLVTNGWTAAAAARLNAGDIFTIAGVFAVNPQTRQSTGQLQQFVVTANVSSDGSGNATIPISPAITPSGQFQNVTASPGSGALLTVVGTASTSYAQHIAYHRDAFTFACADLQMPNGVDMAARMSDPQLGMSIRLVRAYNINTDQFPCRLDILYGWKALYPEWACRITS